MDERRPPKLTLPPIPPPVILPPGATEMDALVFQKLVVMETQTSQKLTEIQQAINSLVPLLETIIAHLEASTRKPEVPIASYEAMYEDHPIIAGPPEGELVAETIPQAPERPGGWWGRLFTTRETP